MEAVSLAIFLCAFFVFSAEGEKPRFTKETEKEEVFATEGDNVTLEWQYTVGGGQPYSQVIFASEIQIMDKYSTSRPPWIRSSYKGRLLMNITNDYTSIILLGVKRTDEGSYRLTVVNQDRDRTDSRKVDIFVLYLDQPKIHLTDNRPVERTDVTLNCTASGKPDPTISWTVNGSPLHASGNSGISFRNGNKELTMMNVNKTDSGEYQCVAHNILGNISSNASTLSVQYQPEVALNPLNTTKAEGESITWSCTATGDPEPKISWMFNGSRINITYSPNTFFSNDRQKMTITNVSRTERGEYQCLASNMLGNTSSQVATLDVIYIPEITAHPQNETRKEGDNATFICNAIGNPLPKISWNKGGAPLRNNSRISLSADNKHLTIANVSRVDSGAYRCVAINILGNDTSNPAYLGVLYKPNINPLPRTIQRIEGGKVTFFCNASGNPLPRITWTINGNSVDTSNSSRMNLFYEGKRLTVKNVSRRNSGVYRCEAENSIGNVTSKGTTLRVHYKPDVTIIDGPRQFAVVGKSKELICKYDALPPVSKAQWIKDGDVIARNSSLLVNESRFSVLYYNKSQIQLLINQSTSQDAGNYTCLIINSVGNSSQKTSVISQELPLITIHPEGKTPIEGKKITLFCNATGNPEPSISWVKDGSLININSRIGLSEDNKRLTITNISRTDSGEYQCVARNRVGNDTSNSRVDVLFEPEVTIDGDQEQYVAKGSNIRLICRYEASPPVSEVQWIKERTVIAENTSMLINDSRVTIPSFNESQIQLSITAASLKDGGNYICKVTNNLNSTQDTTMIIIKDKPEITTHPQNITTREGQNVTLYCNATGNPVPTISWYKNGYPINNSFSTILSPSHEQLTIRNVNRIDSGDYTCQAKNRVGTDTSNASTINVQFRAEIVSHPQVNVTKEEGSNLTLFCNATGNPGPIILWTKDGSPTNNNSRIRFSKHNRLLTISNVNRTDSGHYRCVANNSLGNGTSNVSTVNIQYKPEITSHPKRGDIKEGGNVTFSCNSTANPLPTTSWTKDKSPITNDSRISYSVVNKVLTIMNVNRKDSGEYRCVASNKLGNDTSEAAELNVKYRPEITKHPQNVTVAERNNVTLTCNATGNPEPQFSWFKVENTVKSNNKINMSAKTSHLTITYVNRLDSGGYLCVAHNEVGNETSIIVILDVQYKPEIATHPHNIRTREGQNVTIYCNATGNPVPTISWYKNEYPISNGFRIILSPGYEQLTIRNVTRIDSGNYTCRGNNSVGANTSDASTINVQFRAEIVYHPQTNVIKEEGSNLTLFCNATGNPIPIILWTKDGSPINNNSRIRFSIHNKLLTISNVNRTDSGHYRCVANNSLGNDTSNVATVDIQYKPEITIRPKSRDIEEGGNVTFSCNSTANPLPTTSWTKDESPITSNSRISYSVANKVLTITNVNGNDSGEYRCVARNKLGNDTSKAAKLNVKYEPEIITDPSDDTVKEGQNATLYCNATGNPLPTISWKKDGHSIGNNSRISYSAESNELRIINVHRTDRGKYHCVANNSIGNASSPAATLAVEYKSEITTHPSNVTETEGESVTLHCNAIGYPLPTLSWTKDGSDIGNNSRISFSADKKQLAITKASRVDSGAYRCVANNSLGNDTSMAAVVDVQFAPEISIHPRNVTIVRGDSVTFSCSVVGNPTPSVVWTKDGRDLNVTENSRFNLSSRKNNHSLEIAEVHRSDSGQYRCVAENSKNISNSSAATLTVQYVPDPPKDVKVISRASREVNVSWTAGSNGNSVIQNYTVEIREDNQTFRDAICQGTLLKNNCVIYSTRVCIKELLPWTTYYLRVLARNMIGPGNYSSVVNVTTEEEVPSSAPPFNVTVLNSTAVNVSWQMLTKEDAKGDILGYYILYKRKNEPEVSWKNRTVNGADITFLVLAFLDEYTPYQFAIQAFNSKGVSDRSEIEERKTDEDAPSEAPKWIPAVTKNSTSIELAWEPVPERDLNGNLTEYFIRYTDDETIIRRNVERYRKKVVINGLKASTTYSFKISAATVKGEGPLSKPTGARTDDPPIPPTPASGDIGAEEVSVAFEPRQILSNGEKVSYYQIIVVLLEEGKDLGKPSDKKYVKVIKRYEDKSEGEPYITAEFSNNNKQRKTFPVGDGKYYSRESHVVARRKRREVYTKYFNGKLDDDTEYAVFQRSFSENGYYQDEGFSQFTTKTLPREEKPTPGKKNKHLIVVGVFIGLFLVCVVVVGGIVIVWLRGRRQNNANDDGEEISLEEQGYENFDPEGEIAVEEFEDHVKRLQEDDLFSVEYGAIRSRGNVTSKATLAEENKHKNRYNNIVAYDHSRVKLTPIEGVRGSDYINANFLDGYQKDKAYIATQGPLEHTSDDFWRMVWEQGTKTIVMVTNLEEKGRLKCHQYWPSEGAESYGDIRVTLMQTVQLTEFTIRTMTLKHANNTEQRTVNQYHYTVWPDHGVPDCPSSLLTFVRKASRANPPDAGPMVVHCSAGVGRTGTFIVVDAMLRRIAAEKTVDVYEYVTSLRQDRNFMVQVEEQYILIHDVLVEAIHSGFTEIHANDLRSHIKNLMQVNQTSGQSEMDEEFIRLGRCINTSQLTAQAASMACNVTKNRYPNALPYDETRVKLSVISGVEGSDYINANFIDGYMTRRAFIATQAPIPDTIPDFWRMIWEQESSTIVVLSKETEGDKVKVHQYWPAEKPAHIGTLVVEKTSETSYEDYTMREMKLTHTKESASRVVRQYHYTGWPDSGSPESGTGLIDLIGQVQRWQQQSENTKITVHCSAGVGRTGVFCALSILIGQLKSEGVVDVFQTVKQLRVERPAMVQTKDQYEFIYSALSEYLDSFDAYSNF